MNNWKLLVKGCCVFIGLIFLSFTVSAAETDHKAVWEEMNAKVVYAYQKGQYADGIALAVKAMQYALKNLGKEHPSTLISINNLARLYQSQGRYGEAEPFYKEALQLREKVLGKEHPSTVVSINNLAGLYLLQGRYGEAETLFIEALQLSEKVLGKKHPDTLISINNLAGLYLLQGRYSEAETLFIEALQLSEKVLGKKHPDTLISINNLAGLYQSEGQYSKADYLYNEALQLSEDPKILGLYHPTSLTIQSNYIRLMIVRGSTQAAFDLMEQLEKRLLSRSFHELYSTSEDRVRRLYFNSITLFQDIVFTFAAKNPQPEYVRFAAEVVLRWKQVYAEEYTFQHRLMWVSTDPDVKALRTRISALRSEFGYAVHHADQGRDIGTILRELNHSESDLREKARIIKPELLVAGADLTQVMDYLPKHSALIEFRRFRPVDFKTGKQLVTAWAAYLAVPEIDTEQQVFFKNLGTDADLSQSLTDAKHRTIGLYDRFLGRFENQLKNVKTLYIAPDGIMNMITFAALKMPDGKYLAERFQINRLQTGRDLVDPPPEKTAPLLVAFGGVTYGEYGETKGYAAVSDEIKKSLKILNPNLQAASEIESLKYLKHSLDEAETIGMIFRNNIKDAKVKAFNKQEATEKALRELSTPPRILHLSTHGFYLGNAQDSPLAEVQPMVLSGLALAGAKLGLKGQVDENGDDGLLYSLEALGLNLQGTELVSLSACETGKGVTDYSEGVYGLVRAFRTAGARSVLMTLTPVGDKSSSDFMVKFYETWLFAKEGTSPAQALHETRLHFIRQKRDPAFWSPYVLVGGR